MDRPLLLLILSHEKMRVGPAWNPIYSAPPTMRVVMEAQMIILAIWSIIDKFLPSTMSAQSVFNLVGWVPNPTASDNQGVADIWST